MKKQFVKQKMIINNYEKKFESFNEMLAEFSVLHPEMDKIFPFKDVNHPKDAANDVLEYFTSNFPDVVGKENLPVSVFISKNRVTLKTSKFFTISWRFKFDNNGFISDLIATITTFTKENGKINEDLEAMIVALQDPEANWKLIDVK